MAVYSVRLPADNGFHTPMYVLFFTVYLFVNTRAPLSSQMKVENHLLCHQQMSKAIENTISVRTWRSYFDHIYQFNQPHVVPVSKLRMFTILSPMLEIVHFFQNKSQK